MKPWLLSLLLIVFASRCMASVLEITTTSLPDGKVKTAYSAVIEARGGCTPYKWAIRSGALPAGVTAKASSTTTSLHLAGTPTTAATDSVVVDVTGCGGSIAHASYKVVIKGTASPDLRITTTSLPDGKVKTAYSAVIEASGGCTPYKWAIRSGALPAGVTAKASSTTTSLHLAGTPTTAATDSVVVDVTGCGGSVAHASYKVVIKGAASDLRITTTSLPNGTVDTAYSAVIEASGACTPYKWAIASGALPAGVTAKASSTTTSLHLAGTPTAAATDSVVVDVTGCGGSVAHASYKVVIKGTASDLRITTTSLPNGTVDTAYSAVIEASGACTPYKWAIASGALPAGVTAKASSTTTSLHLAGTPTAAATDSVVVDVTGCGGSVAHASYKIVIQRTANHVVDLSWSASTSADVVGYNVYRGPNGTTWNKINPSLIGPTLYSDSTVANGTTYYYATTAVNASGDESRKSAPVEVVVP